MLNDAPGTGFDGFSGYAVTSASLLLAGVALLGHSTDHRYFAVNRPLVLVSVLLTGAGLATLLAAAAEWSARFARLGQAAVARAVAGSAAVVATVLTMGMLLPDAFASYSTGTIRPRLAWALYWVTQATVALTAVALLVLVAAVAVGVRRGGRRIGARWFSWLSATTVPVLAVGACVCVARGSFSIHAQQPLVYALLVVWLMAAGPGLAARDR
jgi:hypothetical protein